MNFELDGVDSVIYSPVCHLCRRFTGTRPRERTCEAYPGGIPPEIWIGDNPHTEPYEGDGGKQFEPRDRVKKARSPPEAHTAPPAAGTPPESKEYQDEDDRPEEKVPGGPSRFAADMVVTRAVTDPEEVRKAARVYLNQGEEPPKGTQIKTGPRGGRYYEADPRAHPDQFHKVVRTPEPPMPEDLKGKTWLDPHKDNPHPRESYDHHDWIREHEKEFLRNPYDRRRESVNFSQWPSRIYGTDSRSQYNYAMERWESTVRAEDFLETVGIPKDHVWATKDNPSGVQAPGLLELQRFVNLSKQKIRDLKAAGEPIPAGYDPDIDTDDYKAIANYCGNGYQEIKAILRDEDELDEDGLDLKMSLSPAGVLQTEQTIRRMDEVAARERIPIDCDVFHGLTSLRWMKGAEIVPGSPVDLHPGDLLKDESYTSWSMDPWTSYHFAGGGSDMIGSGRYPAVIRINNPKGLPGIYVGGGEQEIILPRGTSYRVTAVDEVAVHPRAGWNSQYRNRPDNQMLKWHVITVEPVLEDDQDRVQKGERIYVTPNHPAPRGMKLYHGDRGGVFYFGEKKGGAEGMLAPKRPGPGAPGAPAKTGKPGTAPAPGPRPTATSPAVSGTTKRFARQPKGKGLESEFRSIEELRTVLSSTKYALISAGRNPKREADEPEETFVKRHEQLRADLATAGYVYTQVLGSYGDFEDSFLVMAHDADRDPMVELGKKYNQDSIIWCDHGTNHMIYTTDSTDDDGNPIAAGSYLKGSGYAEISQDEGDFFTEVHLAGSGENTRFSLNFEWGEMHPPGSS